MRDTGSREPLRPFLRLAFGITWGVGGMAILASFLHAGHPLSRTHPLYFVAGWGPSFAGVLMAAHIHGWPGVRRLFNRLVPTRVSAPWYAFVLVGYPAACAMCAIALMRWTLPDSTQWTALATAVPLALLLDTGPLGEELGWRGFALPVLLRRHSPLGAGCILGAIWAAWHLPTFFISTLEQSRLSIPLFVLNTVSLSVLMTWLYLRSRGDLLLMIAMHFAANLCTGLLGMPLHAEAIASTLIAGCLVLGGGMRHDAALAAS